MLDYLKAIILGVIEGLTEFVPVSSTGHLIIFSDLIEFTRSSADTFSIFIQLGAILAVVLLYKEKFFALFNLKKSEKFSGKRAWILLILGTFPACILGALFYSKIKELLFSPTPVAIALIIGGVLMIVCDPKNKQFKEINSDSVDKITYSQAFKIGLVQCFALWPGMSRAASSILGGIWFGLDRKTSAEFSFLMAVPIIAGATVYDLIKSRDLLSFSDFGIFFLGFVVSFIVAIFAIKIFIKMLSKYTLAPFGWYRIVLGVIVLLVFWL